MNTGSINWTPEMLLKLQELFPVMYNKQLAALLGISWRSLVRKARELGIGKEPDFLNKNREDITRLAVLAHPPNKHKGHKGWTVPNSELTRFKPGNISSMLNHEVVLKAHRKRNETIRIDRLRIKYDLPQKTKLKLNY